MTDQNGSPDEAKRLEALDRYDILDTGAEESFDRVTRLATRLLDVPISTITLIDGHRQWFKSRQGIDVAETPRGPALCQVAIRQDGPLVVPDTQADERFRDNPLVTGGPGIRFYAGVPLTTPDGHKIGTLCAVDTRPRELSDGELDDLTDLARVVMSELELRRVASTDSVTGLMSRRAFKEEAERVVALAVRHRQDLSCIAFDLDHFKAVNDGHGHAAGDQVLAAVGRACGAVLRSTDLVGRIGGEEFAVLLPMTGPNPALGVAEKLRVAIAGIRVPTPSGDVRVTASFGVAGMDRATASGDELLARADTALLSAKAAGRNRCELWQAKETARPGGQRRVLKAGRIAFHAGHAAIDCTVRSLGEDGAGLDVSSTAGIPERFKLQVESLGLYRACRILEKSPRHLQVAFER